MTTCNLPEHQKEITPVFSSTIIECGLSSLLKNWNCNYGRKPGDLELAQFPVKALEGAVPRHASPAQPRLAATFRSAIWCRCAARNIATNFFTGCVADVFFRRPLPGADKVRVSVLSFCRCLAIFFRCFSVLCGT